MESKFPKTSLEEYVKYREAITINFSSMMKRGEGKKEIKEVVERVYSLYQKYFFPRDFYTFDKIDEASLFLQGLNYFPKEDINKGVLHELEHIEIINSLGYEVKGYSVVLLYDYKNKKPSFALNVRLDGSKDIPYEDLKKMFLAPKNPSLIDLAFI
ncbi:MAG: hypothetical protein NUV46_04755 [Nanoarchaeota archaeon]|nr:hypothetical protein [Nanoarchaeota archaeon]